MIMCPLGLIINSAINLSVYYPFIQLFVHVCIHPYRAATNYYLVVVNLSITSQNSIQKVQTCTVRSNKYNNVIILYIILMIYINEPIVQIG